ncbi:MAG: AAA family ATPase, partial [Spirochaetota bacterium]
MSKLRVSRVSILNAPGFEQSGFHLEHLDHAINLVYGPNAAGKTTAIRAMKLLLWPQAAEKSEYLRRCHVDGELISETSRWFAESSFGRPVYQLDGADVRRPETFLSAEFAERYTLALHELMQADNHTFAQLIQRESIGGFDLEQVGTAVGAQQKLSNKNIKPARDYREAVKLYRERKREVEQLQSREQELAKLRGELERARAAGHMEKLYELLREYKQASLRYDELAMEKASYHQALEHLSASDFEQASSLSDTIEKRTEDIKRAQEERGRLEAELQALRFSPSEDFPALLEAWKEECRRLDTLQRDADYYRQKSSEAEVKVAESRRALGSSLADANWEGLTFPDLTRMRELQQKSEELLAAREALERQLHQLPSPEQREEEQQKGIKLLEKLLPLISNSLQPALVAATILLLLGSTAAAHTLPPLGTLLLAGGGIVCAVAAFTRFFVRRKQAHHLLRQLEDLGFEHERLSFHQVHATAAEELAKKRFTEQMESYRQQLT